MNLDSIKKTVQTKPIKVEFKPVGEPTGWFFILRHESCTEVQDVVNRFTAKVRNLALKRKTTQYEAAVAENEDSLRIAHVAGWEWKEGTDPAKGRPPFSNKELKDLLNNKDLGYHLKSFIDEEVGSLKDFLTKSETS